MKNAWLDELLVKRAVRHINLKLRDKFVGSSDGGTEDMKKFAKLIMDFLATYDARVRDTIALRYNLETSTTNGKVSEIKLVKLAWLL